MGTTTALALLLQTTPSTKPPEWLSFISGSYYINLPPIDNWSSYGALRTHWKKLRIDGAPRIGDTFVVADLHNWDYSVNNGQASSGWNLHRIEWGVAADCRGELQSEMRINLVGTPFCYEATLKDAVGEDAHGGVMCQQNNQLCNASCGGSCGYCGLVKPSTESSARVTLFVINQALFDAALKSMWQAAWEALQTRTETQTLTETTVTLTSSTETTTVTTITTVVPVVTVTIERSSSVGSVAGIIALMIAAGCFGLGLGCIVAKRARGQNYGRFNDDVSGVPGVMGNCCNGNVPPKVMGVPKR